jgi:Uma2 family endonuclease
MAASRSTGSRTNGSTLPVQDLEPLSAPLDERTLDEYLPNSIGVKPRYEIIDGVIYLMASPKFWHQWVNTQMTTQLISQLQKHGCAVMQAPFDVYLFWEEGDEKNYVEPDIFITRFNLSRNK